MTDPVTVTRDSGLASDDRAAVARGARGHAPARIPGWVPQAVLIAAIVVGIAVAVSVTPNFLSWSNTLAILRNASIVGIVAVGMTPITLSGSLVSLAISQSAMAAALAFIALLSDGQHQAVAMLAVVALMIVIGVVQGLIVAAGLNPVITTLAAGAVIYGIVANWTDGLVITVGAHPASWGDAKIAGLPLEVIVFAAFTAVVSIAVSKTMIGRQTTLTGARRATADLSGISFRRVTIFAFAVFSAGVAIAGILYGAQFGEGNVTSFSALTIDVVAAVLVGGIAIQGGHGSPLRAAWGALLIAIISNIMLLNDFTTGGRLATQGALVVVVVILLELMRRRRVSW